MGLLPSLFPLSLLGQKIVYIRVYEKQSSVYAVSQKEILNTVLGFMNGSDLE
jgi:hypothetical protein